MENLGVLSRLTQNLLILFYVEFLSNNVWIHNILNRDIFVAVKQFSKY
jgi:hypothetical protein